MNKARNMKQASTYSKMIMYYDMKNTKKSTSDGICNLYTKSWKLWELAKIVDFKIVETIWYM